VSADPYFRLSYDAIRILSESNASSPALTAILHLLCKKLCWDFGTLWTIDYGRVVLQCEALWNNGDFANFETICRTRQFLPNEGLPGKVWVEKQAYWLNDVGNSQAFPRQSVAKMDGLKSGVFVPIRNGSRILGVLELFASTQKDRDAEVVSFLEALGAQIGMFMVHLRSDEAVSEPEAKFRSLAKSAPYAIFTIDEHSLILYANRAAEKTFGYPLNGLIGKNLTLVIPENLRAAHRRGIQRFVETGERRLDWKAIRLPALHKSGRTIDVEIAFEVFYRGGRPTFTGFAKQIGD
jgi:PAS domain S-box-containing protein